MYNNQTQILIHRDMVGGGKLFLRGGGVTWEPPQDFSSTVIPMGVPVYEIKKGPGAGVGISHLKFSYFFLLLFPEI